MYSRNTRFVVIVLLTVWVMLSVTFQTHVARAQDIEYVTSALWTGVADVDVVSNYAYASFQNGLVVINISDPVNPQFVSQVFCRGSGAGLDAANGYVYLADGDVGLCIISVADPEHPALVSVWDSPGFAMDVKYHNGYAYIADWWQGLQIVDVSNPSCPQWVGGYDTDSGSWGICISGTHAYMADGEQGLRVLDISNPAQPALLATVVIPRFAHDVKVVGDYVYVASTDANDAGLWIVNVANPASPIVSGSYGIWSAFGLDIQGHYAYVVAMQRGLYVIDVADPSHPTLVSIWNAPNYAEPQSVCVVGNVAYVAGGNAPDCTWNTSNTGVHMINISNPPQPTSLGFYDACGTMLDVTISGHYAYVAAESPALRVVDLSMPTQPLAVGMGNLAANLSWTVFIAGHYAFLTSIIRGLYVFDVSDPLHPDSVAYYDGASGYNAVCVQGSLAYLASNGVTVLDLSAFPVMTPLSHCMTGGEVYGLYAVNDYVFASASSGLYVIDVQDSLYPTVVGTNPIAAYDVKIQGNYAYLAAMDSGFVIIDISDPIHPVETGRCRTAGRAFRVALQNNQAWIAERSAGVEIVEISDAFNPIVLYRYDTPGDAMSLAILDSLVYVADRYSLMALCSLPTSVPQNEPQIPSGFTLHQNYPNPFNPTTTIVYSLPRNGYVSLRVFDLLGREVAVLKDGFTEAGTHRVTFDGGNLASGIYFCRLQAGNYLASRKLLLIR